MVFLIDCWLMLEVSLEICWNNFYTFRDIAKTRNIARRAGETAKMEGVGIQQWRQINTTSIAKNDEKLKR